MNSTKYVLDFVKKQFLWFALAFAALMYFMWRYFVQKAKVKDSEQPPVPEIPDNGVNIPAGYIKTAQSLAAQVWQVCDGIWTWASEKETVFVSLFNLTDDQLVYVYTVYNNLYFTKNGETMTEIIENELNTTYGGVKDRLVARLKSLGCK